jgi:monofunctional glycosyltransferase
MMMRQARPFYRPPGVRARHAWAAAAALLVIAGAWQALSWPDVGVLAAENPRTTSFIERYRRQASGKAGGGEVEWNWVPYSRISADLKRAVLSSEDIGFFGHEGFDRAEIRKALEEAWEEKHPPRGASTITQQVAKNLWLSPSRNPARKLKEALLTRELERRLTKRRILEIYLNVAEFGPGVYGAEAASRHYYRKPAAALGPREAAELAAGLSRPSAWHPGVASRGYRRQVERILGRMEKAAFLAREI